MFKVFSKTTARGMVGPVHVTKSDVAAGKFVNMNGHVYAGELVVVNDAGDEVTADCCEAFAESY